MMADIANNLMQRREKMTNCKMLVVVILAVFIALISALHVNAADAQKVNINTASAEELAQLKGIGPSHAAKIVAYREKNGPFKMPEELTRVSGIGQKIFEANQEIIIIEEPKPQTQ
jgi:competence protein ComEA